MNNYKSSIRNIEQIVQHRDHGRLDDLIAWLDDPTDRRLAWAAAWALSKVWHPSAALPVARAALQANLPSEIFARLMGTEGIEVLIEGLGSEDYLTRRRAVSALGDTADSRAVGPLEDILVVGMFNHADAVTASLLKLGPDDVRQRTMEFLMKRDGLLVARMAGHRSAGHDLDRFLEPYLSSDKKEIRERAEAFRLAQSSPGSAAAEPGQPHPKLIEGWLDLLTGKDRHLEEKASWNLSRCRHLPLEASPRISRALRAASWDPRFDSRIPLVRALAKTGDPKAVSVILKYLGELDVSGVAAKALEILLSNAAGEIERSALCMVESLPAEILHSWDEMDLNWNMYLEIKVVDLTKVRNMAREELLRRKSAPRL